MPVFLQGRRAFLSSLRRRHRRCNPLSVHRVTNSGLAYPRRAYSCRACPAAATCHSYPHLASPAAAACHSYPHLASSAAAAPLPPPSDTEAPHGPQPFPLGLKCRHGPRPFCSSARSTDTARAPFAVLPGAPVPAPEAQKKADGTAQRPVRRQKATNLSRQHHRGSSSTRQVSARA